MIVLLVILLLSIGSQSNNGQLSHLNSMNIDDNIDFSHLSLHPFLQILSTDTLVCLNI